MWKTILNLFLPIKCLSCGQEGNFICPSCFEKIPLNQNPPGKLKWTNGLMIASFYENPLVKEAIHCCKYNFIKDLALPLGWLMTRKLNDYPQLMEKNPFLIPVPLHQKRLSWRGFNQAELLAREISQQMSLPLATDILIRTSYSLPQVEVKDSKLRSQNIKGAFRINPESEARNYKNEVIILVDDVCTTGATLEECARTLKPLKPQEIWGLVLAKS